MVRVVLADRNSLNLRAFSKPARGKLHAVCNMVTHMEVFSWGTSIEDTSTDGKVRRFLDADFGPNKVRLKTISFMTKLLKLQDITYKRFC